MESGKRRFSLEAAILEWKKSMASSPTLEDGQIAELETSLRDEVRDLVGRGVEEEAAFRRAASEMGPPARAGAEFDKVYGRKPRFVPALAWNYFKVAARHLRRARGFSVINIAGLAVGLACCLLILFWVMDEFGYDRHHLRADRISRLAYEETVDGVQSRLAMVTYAAAPAFTAEIPEIEEYARMVRTSPLVAVEGRVWDERGFYYTDPGFFKIFSHRFLAGDATTALDAPGSIVLTEATARRLFGRTDVVGRTLTLNRTTDFRVSGVIADVPARSHFKFNALASLLTFQNDRRFQNILSDWNRINGWSYLLLKSGADPRNVERKMDAVAVARAGEDFAGSRSPAFRLQKLTDIRLRSRLGTEIEPTGDIRQVYIFSTIAVFILLLAGINFANLSTARSAVRTREIGVRKVLGARRKSLVIQFLGESLFISALALVGAFVLAALALPAFNRLSGKSLTLGSILTPAAGCGAIGLALVCGLGSGFYPAFFLSSFRPILALKGKLRTEVRKGALRGLLVVVQFTISIILVAGTLVLYRQVRYMKTRDLGFDKSQVLVIPIRDPSLRRNGEAWKAELRRNPAILSATLANGLPGRVGQSMGIVAEDRPETADYEFDIVSADYDFARTYGLTIVRGRDFSPEFGSDANGVFLINETAARQLGWGLDAVGRKVGYDTDDLVPIVGVVKDFNYASLRDKIGPLGVRLDASGGLTQNLAYLSLRIRPGSAAAVIRDIRGQWAGRTDRAFDYFFADENFDTLYRAEERTNAVLTFFAALAVFVGCLGLYGLASFTAEQRTKEIGVRKVLGASEAGLIALLSKDFLKLVLAANVIALPAAYVLMRKYVLSNFVYRIGPEFGLLLLVASGSFLAALGTVVYQTLKAARADPAKSLRYE